MTKKPKSPVTPGRPQKNGKKLPPPAYKKGPLNWLLIPVVILSVMMLMQHFQAGNIISWDEFVKHVNNDDIASVKIDDASITGKYNDQGKANSKSDSFLVYYKSETVKDELEKLNDTMQANGVKRVYGQPLAWYVNLLSMFFPLIIMVAIFYFLFLRNMRGGAGSMLMSFGRSKHRLQGKDKSQVTFKDVAGVEEAKDEVAEIIEFLKNPKKFQRLGGRIPRGVLLIGPPGCGKTLLAKAIAGEADVPFFSISGSDFVEMFVGVGASRVRDLFKQAKDNSPCIIFLDEIDAIGRKRGAGFAGGGNDEREQTLNAILVEMDGFDTNDQVIVIAATNRNDVLDNALTRPGRFDRQVVVPLPDLKGRADILKVHAKKITLSPEADLNRIARGTPMFSGAELAAVINEAALLATMSHKDSVETEDLEEARDKIRWGRAKKSRVVDQKDREVTAYHEAGHTLVQAMLEDADPLHKVSIIPRGPMGGATFALPEKDRNIITKKYCLAQIQVCFAGRIAEEMFCGDLSSGASSDIQQATHIVRQMVLAWGMSDKLGLINYESDAMKMYSFPGEKDYSDKTAEEIDSEIKKITDGAYKKTEELIKTNKDKLENIAQALLKYETLDAEDVKVILEGKKLDKPTVADILAVEQAKNNDKPEEKKEESEQSQDAEQAEEPKSL